MTQFEVTVEIHVDPAELDRRGYVVSDVKMVQDLSALIQFTLEAESQTGHWTIVVVLTSDEHLRQLHAQFMDIDEETDVMTFPYDEESIPSVSGSTTRGGDIVISLDRAMEQAPTHAVTGEWEVAFLTVHGTLHLCGWTDATAHEREHMLARQQTILDAFSKR